RWCSCAGFVRTCTMRWGALIALLLLMSSPLAASPADDAVERIQSLEPTTPSAALRLAAEQVKLHPEHVRLHLAYGRLLAAMLDLDGARRELGEALRLSPLLPEAHLAMGRQLELQGDDAGAKRELDLVLDKDPTDAEATRLLKQVEEALAFRAGTRSADLPAGSSSRTAAELVERWRAGDARGALDLLDPDQLQALLRKLG